MNVMSACSSLKKTQALYIIIIIITIIIIIFIIARTCTLC